jgi:hypothetical protein
MGAPCEIADASASSVRAAAWNNFADRFAACSASAGGPSGCSVRFFLVMIALIVFCIIVSSVVLDTSAQLPLPKTSAGNPFAELSDFLPDQRRNAKGSTVPSVQENFEDL